MDPDFYSRYYKATTGSRLHARFCKHVFGIDLCQHGFADEQQLHLLIEAAPIRSEHSIMDIGCGNGMITEYLHDRTGARFTGLDDVSEAIKQARERTQTKSGSLTFLEGDINRLCLEPAAYDVILVIDSIYFSANYDHTISALKDSLAPDGCLLILYSIGPALLGTCTFRRSVLEAAQTPLGEVLLKKGFAFQHHDLTLQDYELAKRRRAFLAGHKEEFAAAGLGFIYENRMDDSKGIIEAVEAGLHRRYLYRARTIQPTLEKGDG